MPLVWQRLWSRGVAGEPGLTDPDDPGDLVAQRALLRTAFEFAFRVAKDGHLAMPPVKPPRQLRPMIQFTKLSDRGLETVQRVLAEDEEFRKRVEQAATADPSELSRAGFLWLVRPEGWQEELAGLGEAALAGAASAREAREEGDARRRLGSATEAKVRAEQAAAAAKAAAARAADDLAAERQSRRSAEARVGVLEAAIAQLEGRQAAAQQSSARLDEALAGSRAAEAAVRAERDSLATLVAALRDELALATHRLADVEGASAQCEGDLGRAIADAAAAAGALGTALAAAASTLSGGSAKGAESTASLSGAGSSQRPASSPEAGSSPGAASSPEAAPWPEDLLDRAGARQHKSAPSPRATGPRRRATALPPALFDDSPEAASYLVRVPGMVLLVDGYNVTMTAWPEHAILEQRRRLEDALAELAFRTGVDPCVVYDGTDQSGECGPRGRPRSAVAVKFSEPGVEADEDLMERVDKLPLNRPVVVATSDRRVQGEVRRRGANVITTPQLLVLLGRGR